MVVPTFQTEIMLSLQPPRLLYFHHKTSSPPQLGQLRPYPWGCENWLFSLAPVVVCTGFNVERVFSETPCTVKPTCHVDTRRVSANISWSELRTGVNGPTQILQCSTTCRAAVHNLSPHRLPRSKVPSTCRRRPRVPPSLHGNGAAGIIGTWVFLLLLLSEIFKCNKFTAYQT